MGEHVDSCLVVVVGGDVGVVGAAASGEGGVGAAVVDDGVDEEERRVDGAALGGVAGLGVPELDMLGDIGGGEADGPGRAGEGEAPVGVDGGDGPPVPVLDHDPQVGAETPLVAASDHLVTHQEPLLTNLQ